jgi:hypothetical protein
MVWHHRRNSVRTYWKQQVGYGRAEALLAAKWPARYNPSGHLAWAGRLYGKGLTRLAGFQPQRIYHGSWGAAPFQSMYQGTPATFWSLPQMPEWYMLVGLLAGSMAVGALWSPLLYASSPLFVIAAGLSVWQATAGARKAVYHDDAVAIAGPMKLRALTMFMHIMQPAARLRGRLKYGLTPWRSRATRGFVIPMPRLHSAWSGEWRSTETLLSSIERRLLQSGGVVQRGGDHDTWDLDQHGGWSAGCRLLLGIEEHGSGIQHYAFRLTPRVSWMVLGFASVCAALGALAFASDARVAGALITFCAVAMLFKTLHEAGTAEATLLLTLQDLPHCQTSPVTSGARTAAGQTDELIESSI